MIKYIPIPDSSSKDPKPKPVKRPPDKLPRATRDMKPARIGSGYKTR